MFDERVPRGARPPALSLSPFPGAQPRASRGRPPEEETPGVRRRLSFDQKELLLTYLIRRLPLFLEARRTLQASHWSEPAELVYGVVWACLLDYYQQNKELPGRTLLGTLVGTRLEEYRHAIPETVPVDARFFLDTVFLVTMEELPDAYGYQLLQLFLAERTVADPLRRYWELLDPADLPADLPSLLQDFGRRLEQVQSVTVQKATSLLADDGHDEAETILTPTALPWLDGYLEGGRALGELYGIMGCYGSGKTRLGCILAAEACLGMQGSSAAFGKEPGLVVYVSGEQPRYDIRRRVLSYTARISRQRFRGAYRDWMPNLSTADDPESLQAYELRPPVHVEGLPFRGERERLQDAVTALGPYFHVLELNCPKDDPAAGTGYLDEIRARLDRLQQQVGRRIDTLVIDYALLFVNRHLAVRGLEPDRNLRPLLAAFGEQSRQLLANPFGATVWILHQLSGAANAKPAGCKLTAADSAESKMFAENLDFTLQLGNKDQNSGCLIPWLGKTRRMAGLIRDQPVLFLRQEYDDMPVATDYLLAGNRIVRRHAPRPHPAQAQHLANDGHGLDPQEGNQDPTPEPEPEPDLTGMADNPYEQEPTP